MGFRDDVLIVLSGGLSGLIEGSGSETPALQPEGSVVNPVRVEEIAPAGTLQDREPFSLFQSGISQPILIGTAAIISLLAVFLIARR